MSPIGSPDTGSSKSASTSHRAASTKSGSSFKSVSSSSPAIANNVSAKASQSPEFERHTGSHQRQSFMDAIGQAAVQKDPPQRSHSAHHHTQPNSTYGSPYNPYVNGQYTQSQPQPPSQYANPYNPYNQQYVAQQQQQQQQYYYQRQMAQMGQVGQVPQIPLPQVPQMSSQVPQMPSQVPQMPPQIPQPSQVPQMSSQTQLSQQAQPKLEKLAPGTILAVGKHHAKIVRYLSEGGFAHVYVVNVDPPEDGKDIACLKRVIVPNKEGLNLLSAEVEVMQRLSNCENVVRYYDSNAARIPGAGMSHCYEVLVLMELCPNKSLLDYMNTRLATKLNEPEILKITLDISRAVYAMHSLKLIHRDIKIENVLIDADHRFKLCDFGSTSTVLRVPHTPKEFRYLQNDLVHRTTPQYRSPEMIDLYRGVAVDEKSDIWALGVFLYKLCYYTTPFETVGELGILHSAYVFPDSPVFSDDLRRLISWMLQEDSRHRPNIYQVIAEVCRMSQLDVDTLADVSDIYGQGEYVAGALSEAVPAIEPFTASKIPVVAPFTTVPKLLSEIQREHSRLSENRLSVEQKRLSMENSQGSVQSAVSSSTPPAVENPTRKLSLHEQAAKLTEQSETDLSPLAVSRQNTSTSTASLMDNVEERFPDLGGALARTGSRSSVRQASFESQKHASTTTKSPLPTIRVDLPKAVAPSEPTPIISPANRSQWSSHNPFPVISSEQSSIVSEELDEQSDLIDMSNQPDAFTEDKGVHSLTYSASQLSLKKKRSSYNPFDHQG